jgi:uncharacterized membrane protein YecN with MAPEG domain
MGQTGVGHIASVARMQTNALEYVPIKLYLQKQAGGRVWPLDHNLLSPVQGIKKLL